MPALADMPTAETFNMTWLGANNWTGLDANYTCPSNAYVNYTTANSGGPIYPGGTFLANQGMYLKSVVCHWTFCAAAPALQIRFVRVRVRSLAVFTPRAEQDQHCVQHHDDHDMRRHRQGLSGDHEWHG